VYDVYDVYMIYMMYMMCLMYIYDVYECNYELLSKGSLLILPSSTATIVTS